VSLGERLAGKIENIENEGLPLDHQSLDLQTQDLPAGGGQGLAE